MRGAAPQKQISKTTMTVLLPWYIPWLYHGVALWVSFEKRLEIELKKSFFSNANKEQHLNLKRAEINPLHKRCCPFLNTSLIKVRLLINLKSIVLIKSQNT